MLHVARCMLHSVCHGTVHITCYMLHAACYLVCIIAFCIFLHYMHCEMRIVYYALCTVHYIRVLVHTI